MRAQIAKLTARLTTVSGLIVVLATPSHGQSYNAVADFAGTNPSATVWSYWMKSGSVYTQLSVPYTVCAGLPGFWAGAGIVPAVFFNQGAGAASCNNAPNAGYFHPGANGELAVVRFTAVNAGSYDILSSFWGASAGTGTTVGVTHNGASLFGPNLVSGLGSPGTPDEVFNTSLTLAVGDKLEFSVGVPVGGSFTNGTTGFRIALSTTTVPEPTSLLLLAAGVGTIALMRHRRRRA